MHVSSTVQGIVIKVVFFFESFMEIEFLKNNLLFSNNIIF
jgi:hypothetical protein